MANQPVSTTDIRQARKKEKHKKKIKKFIALALVAAFGLGVYFTRGMWVPKLEGILDRPHDTIVNDGALESGNFPIELQDNARATIATMNDELVMIDDSDVSFYSTSGVLENTISHTLANPVAEVSGKRILLFDNGGNEFMLLNRKNEVYTKETTDSILYAAISGECVAVVTQSEKYDANMTVYDGNGNEIYKWSSSQRIIDITIKDDASGCYIATFTSVDGAYQSVIHEVDFNSTDEVSKSVELDTLALQICPNTSGDLWVVGDTKLYRVQSDGQVLFSYEYDNEITAYTVNESICGVAVKGVERKTAKLLLLNADDSDISSITEITTGEIKALYAQDEDCLALSETAIDSYDTAGNLQGTAVVSPDYTDFVFIDEGVFFLGYREINKIAFSM